MITIHHTDLSIQDVFGTCTPRTGTPDLGIRLYAVGPGSCNIVLVFTSYLDVKLILSGTAPRLSQNVAGKAGGVVKIISSEVIRCLGFKACEYVEARIPAGITTGCYITQATSSGCMTGSIHIGHHSPWNLSRLWGTSHRISHITPNHHLAITRQRAIPKKVADHIDNVSSLDPAISVGITDKQGIGRWSISEEIRNQIDYVSRL
jgi:hypothetical protein